MRRKPLNRVKPNLYAVGAHYIYLSNDVWNLSLRVQGTEKYIFKGNPRTSVDHLTDLANSYDFNASISDDDAQRFIENINDLKCQNEYCKTINGTQIRLLS